METDVEALKAQILAVLEHPEAEEGLYFRNLFELHEEDERPKVMADEIDILDALNELKNEGKIVFDESGEELIFRIAGETH